MSQISATTNEQLQPTYSPRDYLSVTTIMNFAKCPRSYLYSKCGLTKKDQGNALQYGTAMHKAIPVVMTEGMDAGFKAFLSEWDDTRDKADAKRSVQRAFSQLSHFHQTHKDGKSIYTFEKPPENKEIELDDSTSPFEVPGVIDIGLEVPVVVRIDGLVKHRDTQELWGFEFKTASKLWGLFESLEKHPQVLVYSAVLRTLTRQNIRGMMCEGMLIDPKKCDNQTQPVPVPDHLTEAGITWLRYYGGMLLDAEKKFAELELANPGSGAKAFVQNWCGCTPYPNFYMTSTFPCDYALLCDTANWQDRANLYDVKPDHKFIKLTKEGKDASNPMS